MQLFAAQVQFVPTMDTRVNPFVGIVSVTVTVPLVGPAFAPFDTVTVYVAPCCPCVKFPTCDFVIASTALGALLVNVAVTVAATDSVIVQVGGFV